MAMDDLFNALNMFKQGANELSTYRAIDGANQTVQQIKGSQLDDMQKRQQLTDVSNQLVSHLAAFGTPATTLQALQGALGPKQYANANAMNADALLTGNQGLGQEAKKQQAFEQDPQFKIEAIKAKAESQSPYKQMLMQQALDTKVATDLQKVDARADTQTTRFGNIAKLQGVNNNIADARAMLNGDIKTINLPEIAKVMDRTLSGSTPTVDGAKQLGFRTLGTDLTNAKQYFTGNLQSVDAQSYVDYAKKTLDRVEGINNNLMLEAKRDLVRASGPTGALSPAKFSSWAQARLGENATVDPKTGHVVLDSDIDKQGKIQQVVSQLVQNPNDPRAADVVQSLMAGGNRYHLNEVLNADPKLKRSFYKIKSQLGSN